MLSVECFCVFVFLCFCVECCGNMKFRMLQLMALVRGAARSSLARVTSFGGI